MPPEKFSPWPKTDKSWSRLHIEYAGSIKGTCGSVTKWPEVFKCKTPTSWFSMHFYTNYSIDSVSNNGTQFSSKDFEKFCKIHSIVRLTSPPYYPWSNRMVERFVNAFKRAIKKTSGIEFLSIYHRTPNVNASSGMAPVELTFARKIRSVFDKLRPREKKIDELKNTNRKHNNPGEKLNFKNYKFWKATWEERTINKRTGRMLYWIKQPKWVIKRHLNKKKYIRQT